MTKTLVFAAAAHQLQGPREFQNDSYYAGEDWLVVADGVGGHPSARSAADCAVEYYAELAQQVTASAMPEALMAAPQNLAVRMAESGVRDATTVVAAILDSDDTLWLSSVGDSRLFLIRGTRIVAINHLHNAHAAALLLAPGDDPPYGSESRLTRFIAFDEAFPADIALVRPQIDDLVVLVSDGVEGAAGLQTITDAISQMKGKGVQSITRQILATASLAGLTDNATCVAARIAERKPPNG